MTTSTHPVSPEEIMAFVDGELAAAESQAVSSHLESCTECAAVAQQFQSLSQSLSQWNVESIPSNVENAIQEANAGTSPVAKIGRAKSLNRSGRTWKLWIYGFGGAATAALVLLVSVSTMSRRQYSHAYLKPEQEEKSEISTYAPVPSPDTAVSTSSQIVSRARASAPMPAAPAAPLAMVEKGIMGGGGGGGYHADVKAPSAPMIARTVSLTMRVKDIPTARTALDGILAQHRGYAAQLTINTPENASRSFQASLRIPAQDLAAALGDLKRLGRVENETQSGEEVTQQHTDLVARLKTARETEERFRAILQQRTGKIEDVLQVEQEIERVRGEIEGMEAGQKALEHRVDFASVELTLTEEYKAQLTPPANSVSTRMHNAFVAGYRNALETVVAIVLFFIEFGPTILIIAVIFGLPVYLAWRRYRRNLARL